MERGGAVPLTRRTPPMPEPWCIMGMIGFYGSARAIKVPESRADFLSHYGWTVIARDSDNPLPAPHMLPPGHTYWPLSAMLALKERPNDPDLGDD